MSTDMNITRPSSRVLRPPGGMSTIFGGDEPPAQPKKVETPVMPPTPPAVEGVKVPDPIGKVGILIGGDTAPDVLIASISKALVMQGIKGSMLSQIDEITFLPYAAQSLATSCDVVIAAAFMCHEVDKTISQSLTTSLLQIGLNGNTPVIPAIVVQDSLLEAKAMLPSLAAKWANSAKLVLDIKNGSGLKMTKAPEPEVTKPPVYSANLNDAAELVSILKESLKKFGARGIIGLKRYFKKIDENDSKSIDLVEFKQAIKLCKLNWTDVQVKVLFETFDKDKSGSIDFDEFVYGLRGELTEKRREIVLIAFQVLDKDKNGIIEMADLKQCYDASKHPSVIGGLRTEEEILREFLDTFDSADRDGKITPDEFCDYYANVSASIDEDDFFELMIRNAWHISGGEGWCANSSCKRVIVHHTAGHETVEEIKDDFGMADDDHEAMLENLKNQGITDIEFVKLPNGNQINDASVQAAKMNKAKQEESEKKVQSAAGGVAPEALRGTKATVNNPRRAPGGATTISFG